MTMQNLSSEPSVNGTIRFGRAEMTAPSHRLSVNATAPMSLSGVFDEAFDLYKQHFKTLALISALLFFPAQIALYAIFNTWLLPLLERLQTPAGSTDFSLQLLSFAGVILIGIPEYGLPGLCAFVLLAIMSGPLCVAVSDIYFERMPTIRESYRRALRAIPRLIFGWLFGGLIVFAVAAACMFIAFCIILMVGMIAGIAGGGTLVGPSVTVVLMVVGFVASYLMCMAVVARFTLFISPLLVLEGLPLTAVWTRNQQLVERVRFRRTWAAASMLPLIVFGLQYLILLSATSAVGALQLSSMLEFMVSAAFTAAIVLCFQPYLMICVTMLYYDYRVRGEGLDIVLLSAAQHQFAANADGEEVEGQGSIDASRMERNHR